MNSQNVFIKKDSKFKNFIFSVNLYTDITKENVTKARLLSKVLSGGCSEFPTTNHINRRLAELFGTKMELSVKRVQNNLYLSLRFDVLSEKYSDSSVLSEIINFARSILLNPLVVNNGFNEEIFTREKNILRNEIDALINDKRRYAIIRCNEIACEGDVYGINTQGYKDELEKITPESLFEFYNYLISSCPVKVYAVGNLDENTFKINIQKLTDCFKDGNVTETKLLPESETVKTVEEKIHAVQSKLSMAYTVGQAAKGNEYIAQVFNGLFGGTVVSKLFNNVREKMSLCYYASSAYVKEKGLFLVQSGIDTENYEKARDAINAQLEEIQNGNFTDDELKNAAAAIESSILSTNDENSLLLSFYEKSEGEKEILTPNEQADRIKNAAVREKVIDFAKNVKLNTVFLLRGGKDDE